MKKIPWLRILVHVTGILPLASIGLAAWTGSLTVNPIQAVEQRLGRAALYLLVASLAVTPVATLTGWRSVLPRRRALGLYAFLYASLHLLIFAGLDYGFNFGQIFDLLTTKPYIVAGALAFSLLVPLAVTSFDYFIRRMKKNWKRLHWLVYPAALVVIVHFAWARKGSLLQLQGDVLQPLLWGLLLATLLTLRLPPVRKAAIRLRQKLEARRKAKNNL
jgi:sulfoxide reductase heme-binding subunit YedZ